MQSKYDIDIILPNSYVQKNHPSEKQADFKVEEIADLENKVKKRVIRGVLKHDAAQNK